VTQLIAPSTARAEKTRAERIVNKPVIIGHVGTENYVIDWDISVDVNDGESDKTNRFSREAVWSIKSKSVNQYEGSYQLSHV